MIMAASRWEGYERGNDMTSARTGERTGRLAGFLHHPADLRPVLFTLSFCLYQVLVFLCAEDPLTAFVLVAVPHFILHVPLMNVLHISIHSSIFRSAGVEFMFGTLCSLALGFTRTCFRLDHMTHHRHYLDPSLDTNSWRLETGPWRRHRYALRHLFTVYSRSWHLAKQGGRPIALDYIAELSAVLAVLAAFLLAKPGVAATVFLYPMVFNVFAVYYWAHHQHADLDSVDPLSASRTYDNAYFNWLAFNVGYHAAHHHSPAVHWSKLPALHESLRDRIPAHLVLPSIPWLSSDYGNTAIRTTSRAIAAKTD
jgi:fatty acid desaturase